MATTATRVALVVAVLLLALAVVYIATGHTTVTVFEDGSFIVDFDWWAGGCLPGAICNYEACRPWELGCDAN